MPQLIDNFIESSILPSILEELCFQIPLDLDTIPNIIYFVNMYCLMESGRKLETQYNIIGRILEVMVKKGYIEVLASSKGLLKGKGLDSIAMEYEVNLLKDLWDD